MCGGSLMYIDALTEGLDDLPTVSDEVRALCYASTTTQGPGSHTLGTATLDPAYMERVDLSNPRRIIHAIEMGLMAGRPYSERSDARPPWERPYDIVRMAIRVVPGAAFRPHRRPHPRP